jgi:allantoicase
MNFYGDGGILQFDLFSRPANDCRQAEDHY